MKTIKTMAETFKKFIYSNDLEIFVNVWVFSILSIFIGLSVVARWMMLDSSEWEWKTELGLLLSPLWVPLFFCVLFLVINSLFAGLLALYKRAPPTPQKIMNCLLAVAIIFLVCFIAFVFFDIIQTYPSLMPLVSVAGLIAAGFLANYVQLHHTGGDKTPPWNSPPKPQAQIPISFVDSLMKDINDARDAGLKSIHFQSKEGGYRKYRLAVRKMADRRLDFVCIPSVGCGTDEEKAILNVSEQFGNNIAYLVAARAIGVNGSDSKTISNLGGLHVPVGKEYEVWLSLINQGFSIHVALGDLDLVEDCAKWYRKIAEELQYDFN